MADLSVYCTVFFYFLVVLFFTFASGWIMAILTSGFLMGIVAPIYAIIGAVQYPNSAPYVFISAYDFNKKNAESFKTVIPEIYDFSFNVSSSFKPSDVMVKPNTLNDDQLYLSEYLVYDQLRFQKKQLSLGTNMVFDVSKKTTLDVKIYEGKNYRGIGAITIDLFRMEEEVKPMTIKDICLVFDPTEMLIKTEGCILNEHVSYASSGAYYHYSVTPTAYKPTKNTEIQNPMVDLYIRHKKDPIVAEIPYVLNMEGIYMYKTALNNVYWGIGILVGVVLTFCCLMCMCAPTAAYLMFCSDSYSQF
eukprot:gene2034-1541_t